MLLIEELGRGFAFTEATVDRDAGIIHNVSLLGRVSANGRTYSDRAMGEAAELHKGVGVYVDHPGHSESSDRGGVRSVRDLAGQVISARVVGDRVKGSVQVLRGPDPGELLLALAEMPDVAGFSHRATGTTSRDGSGREIVDSITAVHGADIVSDPATVAGLFESINKGEKMKKEVTPDTILESAHRLFSGSLGGVIPGATADESKKPVTAETILECRKRILA